MTVCRITVKGTRSSLGDVRQVTEQHALGPFLDGLGKGRLSPDGPDEVVEMIEVHITAGRHRVSRIGNHLGFDLLYQLVLVVKYFIVTPAQVDQAAFIPVNDKSAIAAFRGEMVATPALPGDRLSFCKFKCGDLGIRRLPVILEGIATAGRDYLGGVIDSQEPATAVYFVCAVVTGLTCTPMPEPVPVVMNKIVLVCPSWRWTLPQLEIEGGRHGYFLSKADGFAIVGIPGLGQIGIPDGALFHLPGGIDQRGERTALTTHLDVPLIGVQGLCEQFTLIGIMPAWLFHINMFAVGRPEDRGGCMPVIGRCDHQCIKVLLLHEFPDVMDDGRLPRGFFQGSQPILYGFLFYVTDIGYLYIGQL